MHKDGRLQVLCRTRNARIATAWSNDNGDTWSKVTLLDVPNNNSGTDAVTLQDGRHVLIYNNFSTLPGTPKGPRTPLCVANLCLHWKTALSVNIPIQVLFREKMVGCMLFIHGEGSELNMRK